MLTPIARHKRCTRWALTGLEVGALLFLAGLALFYFNPFWHFDEAGILDHRVHWWNTAGEILIGTGLFMEVLALAGGAAALVSRFSGLRAWPYLAAALIVCCALLWINLYGLARDLDVRFEWNAGDGFNVFRVQDEAGAPGHAVGNK